MKRALPLLICLLLALTGIAGAQENLPLYVDVDRVLGPISPYVYGANYGPLQTVPLDLADKAQESGIRFLRFPGGRWGDQNNIQHFHIDMFIKLARQLGAEPSISVRLEGGTPEAAAELVRYTNIERGYGVRYWAIGNEPNLFDHYTTADHNRQWRAIAEAMLAVDPTILLIGPDTSQYSGNPLTDPRDSLGRDWVREFLLANGDLVDIVAVHRYPFPRSMANPVTTVDDLRQNAPEWSRILPALRTVIRETTGRDDVPVAITEANSHWSNSIGGEATPDSLYNAIWWADVLGRLIHDGAFIVNYFDFQSNPGRGGWGLLGSYDVRPTYYTYQLYKRFGSELVYAESSVLDLSIYAALRDDGMLTVLVVNLGEEPQTHSLHVAGAAIAGVAEVWRLDAVHNAERLDDVDLRESPIVVPGQSVTLYLIPIAS
ncbi:MAG: hypothetical protein ACUVSU_09685 [Aggregatilineaceae bacterium]